MTSLTDVPTFFEDEDIDYDDDTSIDDTSISFIEENDETDTVSLYGDEENETTEQYATTIFEEEQQEFRREQMEFNEDQKEFEREQREFQEEQREFQERQREFQILQKKRTEFEQQLQEYKRREDLLNKKLSVLMWFLLTLMIPFMNLIVIIIIDSFYKLENDLTTNSIGRVILVSIYVLDIIILYKLKIE